MTLKKKKILWISHLVPYPPKGGVLQRSFNLLKEVSKEFDVHLVSFVQKKLITTHYENYDAGIEDCKSNLLKFCSQVDFFEIPQETIKYGKYITGISGLFSLYGYNIAWLRSTSFKKHLETISYQFDLVHFDTISLAIYIDIFPGTKKILDHHNIESHMLLRRSENESSIVKKAYFYVEGKKLEKFERKVVNEFSLNITCSELDSERLLSIAPGAVIESIPNGVDIDYFHPLKKRQNPNPENFKIIFAGRLNAYTNDQAAKYIAFELWPRIRMEFPGAKLYLVGQNPSEEIIQRLKTDERFFITGFVDDIRTYIDEADIYICPITDGGGTKLKVLDALAMGIPLLANKIACEGIETVEDESVLYSNNTQQYLDNISVLIKNPEKYQLFSSSGLNLVKNQYTFLEIGRVLTKAYLEL
ncbi:MAG: glycosyltransferase involved in cell wall biosynthesis [Francisellaceae bacterium]|jgi:glycosyltransferase involved in cell wall biosynthesis